MDNPYATQLSLLDALSVSTRGPAVGDLPDHRTSVVPTPDALLDTGTEVSRLGMVNWDFPDRVAHSDIEGLHPYPAKFITELPRALMSRVSLPQGTAVLDPFCGSGTTLVECQRRGLASIGIDLNPIACLMSRVKTAPVSERAFESVRAIMVHARSAKDPSVPSIPNLDHWFTQPVQEALSALSAAILAAPPQHHDILRLALSSIIVRVSNQESDTRYAAVRKRVAAADVYSAFERAANRTIEVLSSRNYSLTDATVIEADTLAVTPVQIQRRVGLVITSPPYPNAYEYWLYHKYRMWWLGFDPLAVKDREIGARAHFFKRNRHTAEDFARQMATTFQLLRAVMVLGGYACFVVGRSKIHGAIVDNARVIEHVGRDCGFHRVFAAERVLSANRKSFNLSHANIKTETVLVLRLDGGQCD